MPIWRAGMVARPRRIAASRACLVWAMAGALAACSPSDNAVRATGGEPGRGKAVIERVGCGVCHVIPGVRGPDGVLGPPLVGLAGRVYLAGSLPNRPALLAQFVRDAPSLVPQTAMPELPLDDQEAHDVAAYLYSQR
jgi:mono/diheme cytochrome c family protein